MRLRSIRWARQPWRAAAIAAYRPAPPAPMTSTSLSSRIIARTHAEKTPGAASLSFVIDCRALYADLHVETMPARQNALGPFARDGDRQLLDHVGHLMQYSSLLNN